jgi:Formate--tetrahydrofolate ligase
VYVNEPKDPQLGLRREQLGAVIVKYSLRPLLLNKRKVIPMEELNLHRIGDLHAIAAANNLLGMSRYSELET